MEISIKHQKELLNELLNSKDAIIEAKEAHIKALTTQIEQFTAEKETQKKRVVGEGTSVASDVVVLK